MANDQKNIAFMILGIVSVIAVVGLVLLFVQGKSATGEGVYGGAIKRVEYPYWVGRGVPRNIPGSIPGPEWDAGSTYSKDQSINWNWEGSPHRSSSSGPGNLGDVPGALTACGSNSLQIPSSDGLPQYYASLGYNVVLTEGSKGSYACVFPPQTMVGGIAGYS